MFFLGASAHIIIYLLIPAFLTVCLFINGQPGTPDAMDLLPVQIAYEPQISTACARDTFVCTTLQQESEQEISGNRNLCFQSPPVRTVIADVTFPNDRFIRLHSLRAPPAC